MNAQCFWLSSQSGQTHITLGQKHWRCAGGRRWCGAGSPSALTVLLCVVLVVLLCVWCVAGIGARAHQEREERYSIFILRPPKLVRMRVRVRIRVHVTGGVLARSLTYVGRLSNSLTGGGQTKVQRWPNKVDLRAEWPLQGIQSEKVASGRCSPISTNHVALFGLSCTRLGLLSTLHLALAIFQQGAPCFGHRPKINVLSPVLFF